MRIVRYTQPRFRQRGAAPNRRWEVRFWMEDTAGRRFRKFKGGFTTKGAAESWFTAICEEIAKGRYQLEADPHLATIGTLDQLVAAYAKEACVGKSPQTLAREQAAFARFMQRVPGTTRLGDLTLRVIDSYIAARSAEVSPATVNTEVAKLRHVLAVAVRWKLLESNPFEEVKKMKVAEGEVVFLEEDEQRALIRAAGELPVTHNSRTDSPHLRPLIVTALYTGCRQGELFNLRWRDVDLERRVLTVQCTDDFTSKSRRNRSLGLHEAAVTELTAWRRWFGEELARANARAADPELRASLRLAAERRAATLSACLPAPDQLVFPSLRTVRASAKPAPLTNVSNALATAATLAQLDHRKISMHVFRHTFAVGLARAGVPLIQIARLLGHANLKTTEIYLRFSPDEGLRSTDRLPNLGAQPAQVLDVAAED